MIPVVISDIHSRWNKLMEVLRQADVLDQDLERRPGFQLIQLGDAVSAGYGMKEAQFYRDWVNLLEPQDVELVGNHEAPIMLPSSKLNFYGYNKGDMGTGGCDPELITEVLARQHVYEVAHSTQGWLITHAGVMRHYQKEDAVTTADYLNELWKDHVKTMCTKPLFECPICNPESGVLWVRDLEKSAKDPTQIKQMFGHTPDGPTLSKGGTMWNIDTPRVGTGFANRADAESYGGVCAMRWDDSKQDWEQFYVA